ncbi:MAG: hypothetical protein JWN13_1754 [Betaproteobacteria bacterium]|jgi:hypothetical protein|nr:hypothetical protein [Betaproteobacteria bacterium]MEA3153038.1 hypothetical protein [Betaproteobacteria bacterium]
MTESMLVYDPTAPSQNEPQQLRRSLEGLRGAVVGFIDNAKPNFQYLVDDVAELLTQKYGVTSIIKRRKRGAAMPAAEDVIDELSRECDLVITGSGD